MSYKLTPEDLAKIMAEMRLDMLAVDGGGSLGAGVSLFLKMFEADFKWPFKAYVATSVGSLLTLMYAVGYNRTNADDIFMATVTRIFAKPSLLWRCDPTRPKYDSKELEAACLRYFGNMKMTDIAEPVFITSADMATGRPKIWDNSDNMFIRDVVLCSTAAPTYFAPRQSRYCDGGLVANNPSVVGIGGLKRAGVPLDVQHVFSLATGGSFWSDPKVGARMTQIQWIAPLIKFMLDGNEERDEFIAQEFLDDRYLRIDPQAQAEFALDDLDKLTQWRALWAAAYNRSRPQLAAFF